ncbi:MAG TPA: TetR/AcrR family transcriptional regulator [Thermoleophilaceae bacterium]|nr:TetR/AcrR family transcriptional regulator [Thermoleophilaceae bacterium]
MPKIVDHDARRAELAAAVWRLASRDGLDGVTTRRVAAEAGWSTGSLAHYFADKEELILFAFETVADRVGRRVLRAAEHTRDPLELVRSQLVEGLPLDAERRAEVRVWFAFLGLALTRPRLAQAGREAYRVWRGRIAKTLAAGQRDSLIDDSLDCEREAAELVALVDGLAIQASFEPRAATKDRQLELLDDRLAALRAPAATHGSRNR